jgi:cation diffusion facilitator family transporter
MDAIKERAALSSVAASAALAAGKLAAAFLTGSLGLLTDALHALLDVGATLLTYFAVRISGKPADDKHQYGHGKIEAIAALIETGLLLAVAIYAGLEGIARLSAGKSEIEPSIIAFAVLGASIIVDIVRSRSLRRIAKETNSHALAADALHFSSDLVSSTMVLGGLIAAQFGFPQGDAIAAIGVAVFIAIAGYRLARQTIDTLMDAGPAGITDKIRGIVHNVRGVVAVDAVRARAAGASIFADIEISVARTLPLERVTAIRAAAEAAVQAEIPGTTITIIATPRALDGETVQERVRHVAALMHLPVHHVTVQHAGDQLSVSLDLEVDAHMPIKGGHAIASELERAIAEELGPGVEVETHLEPLFAQNISGEDVDAAEAGRIRDALVRKARETGVIIDVHHVRARQNSRGLVINYHCCVDPDLTVAEMHTHVDAIEHAIRQEIPHIIRIVGHAEPASPGAGGSSMGPCAGAY